MTKAEMLAPGSPRHLQLRERAKEINELQEAINIAVERVKAGAKIAVMNAALAGKALILAKKSVPHGQFMDWVSANCPGLNPVMTANYIRLAQNWEKIPQLQESDSIKQALLLCAEFTNGKPKVNTSKPWPWDVEGVRRLTRVMEYIEKHPIRDWSEEAKEELRSQVAPILPDLFPDKFEPLKEAVEV